MAQQKSVNVVRGGKVRDTNFFVAVGRQNELVGQGHGRQHAGRVTEK